MTLSDMACRDEHRVAIYARARPEAQGSLDRQVSRLEAWLAEQHVVPLMVVRETASADEDDRPGLEALLGAGEKRQIDHVVMIDLARLARKLTRVVGWLHSFEACGITVTIGSRGNRLAAANVAYDPCLRADGGALEEPFGEEAPLA